LNLILLFTVIPALEIYLLIRVGAVIGGFETFMVIMFTGVVGANLAKSQGFAVLKQLEAQAKSGEATGTTVVEGVMILIGGILLITPGLLTDFCGVLLMFSVTRKLIAPHLIKAFKERAVGSGSFVFTDASSFQEPNAPIDEQVIEQDDSSTDKHFKHPIQ
jgi:UPF0716 protein FxsA